MHPAGAAGRVRRRPATATGRMISERTLLARVGDVLQKVGAVNQAMADVLVAAATGGGLDAGHLRELAHGLVALGGTMTSLGVEMASDADKHN